MASAESAAEDAMDVEQPSISAPSTKHLSTIQQHAVDGAFEKLFGYRWGTHFDMQEPQTHQERLLVRILGKRAAATVLYTKSKCVVRATMKSVKHSMTAHAATTIPRKHPTPQTSKATRATSTAPATTVAPKLPSVATRVPIAAPIVGGVDNILKALQEGQGTTTIARTSADWESFKDQTGLGDKLEEKAEGKDAFLNRQAFLTRVDHRTFELERQDRDKERAKRGK